MEELRPYTAVVVAFCARNHRAERELPMNRVVIRGNIDRQKIGAHVGICRAEVDGLPCRESLKLEYVLTVKTG